MTPNFVVVVNVYCQSSCHIGSGMPYILNFSEEIVALSGVIIDIYW